MVKKLSIKDIQKQIEKLTSIDEKIKRLEEILQEIKDEELRKQVEKLILELLRHLPRDTLESKFGTRFPAPELGGTPVKGYERIEPPTIPLETELEKRRPGREERKYEPGKTAGVDYSLGTGRPRTIEEEYRAGERAGEVSAEYRAAVTGEPAVRTTVERASEPTAIGERERIGEEYAVRKELEEVKWEWKPGEGFKRKDYLSLTKKPAKKRS